MVRWIPCLLLAAAAAHGQYLRIEMGYDGKECSSCSTFIENKLKRNPGVQSIDVDGKRKMVTVVLKPENTVKFADVHDFVQQTGYTPLESHVLVVGVVRMDRGTTSLEIGNGETLVLNDPEYLLRELVTRTVEIEGSVTKGTLGSRRVEMLVVSKAKRVK